MQYGQRLALGHFESKLSCTRDIVVSRQRVVSAAGRDNHFSRNCIHWLLVFWGVLKVVPAINYSCGLMALSILILIINVLSMFTYSAHAWQRRINL
jgi:hypothetical protein